METLTKQENKVAYLITSQYSEKMIADKLFISPKTVPVHKRNIFKKWGVKNIAGVAVKYIQSLENPKAFKPAVMCLLLQLGVVFCNVDYDAIRVRKSVRRTVKVRRNEK